MNNKGTATMSQTKAMTQVALFAALIFIMAFTPFLGYIPLGFTRATIIHIPVIIGSLMLGAQKGSGIGICIRTDQLYQQYHQSQRHILRLHPILFAG